ncbi:unnamed protein product [Caenorhabditis sp. 36 PRJEB53466]|nr:unnamed protein product [Caenorhabditis sp. 36 PRJEB53466]
MKVLVLIITLFCVHEARGKTNHEGTFFLEKLNDARAILASGVLRKIDEVKSVLGLSQLNLPPMGPAADMYRLRWSRELEVEAEKQVGSLKGVHGTIKTNGFRGFYWLHDVTTAVMKILEKAAPNLPFQQIEQVLSGFATALETLLLILWVGVSYPKKFPIPADAELGISEAFFAHRYEIGCTFSTFAVCMLREGVSEGQLFKPGVACSQCPTHCEFYENKDESVEEGDLCAAPTGAKGELSASGSWTMGPLLVAFIATIVYLLQ